MRTEPNFNKKLRISTEPDREIKPIFISLVSRKKKTKEMPNPPLKQNQYFCCGSL